MVVSDDEDVVVVVVVSVGAPGALTVLSCATDFLLFRFADEGRRPPSAEVDSKLFESWCLRACVVIIEDDMPDSLPRLSSCSRSSPCSSISLTRIGTADASVVSLDMDSDSEAGVITRW